MAIPDYQSVMSPLLRFLADKKERNLTEAVEAIADHFRLSDEERKLQLASGQQTVIRNRTGWARTYLKKAGLLESTRRGFFRISDRGLTAITDETARIDVKYLEQFPEFVAFKDFRRERSDGERESQLPPPVTTPEEELEDAYQRLNATLEAELLEQVKASTPSFFEQLVIELLVRMGYGGSLRDAGEAVGRSGDGGIDGIIKEDRLGLDAVYVQAKKWEGTVGRPEIQKFAGALQGQRARKGVFITTSTFSSEAVEFASRVESRIVLMDGASLVRHMIENNVGVSVTRAYEVKKIDSDYFAEE